ncbi:MAG: phosphoglycerate kinase, partial [Patescibacteria group bacterium]
RTIIISHLGDDGSKSLAPVLALLQNNLPIKMVESPDDWLGVMDELLPGEIYLLENIRRNPGEMQNDKTFAEKLAGMGDIYVNDAFAVSHREHASIVGIPKFTPGFMGFLFEEEVANLSKVFNPEHPFILLLGGAKFSTKLTLIEKFINLSDIIFIYGALAHAFFKELGYEMGQSLVETDTSLARQLLNSEKIYLPIDVRVKNGAEVTMKHPDKLKRDDNILDVGLDSVEQFSEIARDAKLILWNGPLGRFEFGFRGSTDAVAKIIAEHLTAKSIVGGGDTLDSIKSLNLLEKFSFISTGGGAMLDFLALGTLPGLEALK